LIFIFTNMASVLRYCLRSKIPNLANFSVRTVATSEKATPEPTTDKKNLVLTEHLLDNRVCRLVMNDPKKRNALSLDMLNALYEKLTDCSMNDKLRAIILAASPPVFSAGHDLKELTTKSGFIYHAKVFVRCTEVMCFVQDMQLPVIAEVKGVAAAAGCQLAASCDVVVAADNAKFSTPGVKSGLFCSTPGVAVSRAVPRKVALDMLLTGDPISAQDALKAGLVSRVVPEAQVEKEALSIAEKICELSRPVIALGKTFFYLQVEKERKEAYRYAERVMLENLRLRDCQEGIDAFFAKRKPNWRHTTEKAH